MSEKERGMSDVRERLAGVVKMPDSLVRCPECDLAISLPLQMGMDASPENNMVNLVIKPDARPLAAHIETHATEPAPEPEWEYGVRWGDDPDTPVTIYDKEADDDR